MKWSRFLLGVVSGAIIGYLLYQEQRPHLVKPEKVVRQLRHRYQSQMPIVGSWILVEPEVTDIDGLPQHVYHCGLTGLVDNEPHYFEFQVNADTGEILSMESSFQHHSG